MHITQSGGLLPRVHIGKYITVNQVETRFCLHGYPGTWNLHMEFLRILLGGLPVSANCDAKHPSSDMRSQMQLSPGFLSLWASIFRLPDSRTPPSRWIPDSTQKCRQLTCIDTFRILTITPVMLFSAPADATRWRSYAAAEMAMRPC